MSCLIGWREGDESEWRRVPAGASYSVDRAGSPLHETGAPLIPYCLERDMDELFRRTAEHLLEGLAAELARNSGDADVE